MHRYDTDVAAWAMEQAALLRAGQLDGLDLPNLAEEIEDVGRREHRELISRLAVLLAHLLKWQYQPARRGASWERTIRAQRKDILYHLDDNPSLRGRLTDARLLDLTWSRALALAVTDTGLDCFPEACPWDLTDEALNSGWWPGVGPASGAARERMPG